MKKYIILLLIIVSCASDKISSDADLSHKEFLFSTKLRDITIEFVAKQCVIKTHYHCEGLEKRSLQNT